MSRRSATLLSACALLCIALASGATTAQTLNDAVDLRGHHFIHRQGHRLFHRGVPFRVAGASNYYPMYASQTMVDDLLDTAAAAKFNVVRFWGSLDIGNQDGSSSIDGIHNGVYFHYFDGTAPAFNDSDSGLQHLDYVIYKAGQLDLKVIIPFVNNWSAFGGIDQYVRWAGGQYHDQFFSDPTIRGWYRAWVAHLLNHVNIYTGVAYKDDATIMAWELANEPRCTGSGAYPASPGCSTRTLTAWAREASGFVKTIDRRHLVSVGDEGFYCDPSATDWTENCSQGVDTIALARLPAVDAMSFHLYPDSWGKDAAWGTQWIQRHIEDGHRIDERVLLGEFGWLDKATRNPVYKQWTDTVLKDEGGGALYWLLSGKQDNGTLYPDYDGFTVYCPSPVCTAFTNFASFIELRPPFDLAPVADDDLATTTESIPVTLAVTTNDITYGRASLDLASLDLDPATPGVQQGIITAFGSYAAQPGGNVLFMPAPGFTGQASTPYTVADSLGRVSAPAKLIITVKGNPNTLYTFEDGTDTWASANWQTNAGTLAQTMAFATDGTHALEITTADGGWFGPTFAAPLDLTNIKHIKIDIGTQAAGTSQSVAVQVGSGWTWCQTGFGWINAQTTTTVDVDLAALFTECGATDTSVLQAMYVYYSGSAVYDMDYVRTE
jgi:mannan endo-1,4-beta-mannosidase